MQTQYICDINDDIKRIYQIRFTDLFLCLCIQSENNLLSLFHSVATTIITNNNYTGCN